MSHENLWWIVGGTDEARLNTLQQNNPPNVLIQHIVSTLIDLQRLPLSTTALQDSMFWRKKASDPPAQSEKRNRLRPISGRVWRQRQPAGEGDAEEEDDDEEKMASRLEVEALKKMIAEKDRTIAGTFFATIETIWEPRKERFRGSFEGIRRPEGYFNRIAAYRDIVNGVCEPLSKGLQLQPRIADKSGNSNAASNKKGQNFMGGNGKEVGHQLPDSKTCAPTYGIGAQLNLGFDVERYCREKELDRDTTIAALQHIVCGNEENRRFGLRSSPLNHLMVPQKSRRVL